MSDASPTESDGVPTANASASRNAEAAGARAQTANPRDLDTLARNAEVAGAATPASQPDAPLTFDDVRDVMWRQAGLFRTKRGLSDAVARLERAYAASLQTATAPDAAAAVDSRHHTHEQVVTLRTANLTTVALLVARAALRREESRGGHFRADFPERDDLHWKVHVAEQRRQRDLLEHR